MDEGKTSLVFVTVLQAVGKALIMSEWLDETFAGVCSSANAFSLLTAVGKMWVGEKDAFGGPSL